jgi:hypothetical protein
MQNATWFSRKMPFFQKIGKIAKNCDHSIDPGRDYDHSFQRFSPIFGERNGDFLESQCYDHFFSEAVKHFLNGIGGYFSIVLFFTTRYNATHL